MLRSPSAAPPPKKYTCFLLFLIVFGAAATVRTIPRIDFLALVADFRDAFFTGFAALATVLLILFAVFFFTVLVGFFAVFVFVRFMFLLRCYDLGNITEL
jgi:hypothetical protein